jgi:hypothetical protein
MIPILLAVGIPSAKAVPLFCSDVVHYAERLLTGCGPDSDPSITGMGAYLPREASTGASHEIDALLSRTRPNPLVQVGPNGLTDEPLAGKATDDERHDGEALKGIPAQADENAEKSFQSTISKDENWYYMNVDRDGTYLFFGDPERLAQLDQLGEWPTAETPDDGLPKGIGIGKRWRF